MISVHVRDPEGIDLLEPKVLLHALDQTVQQDLGKKPAVEHKAMPVIRYYDGKVLAQSLRIKLVKVRSDSVHQRESGRFRDGITLLGGHLVNRIAADIARSKGG